VLQHYWSTTALSAAATLCHSSIKIVLVTFLCAAALLVDNSFVGSCNIVWQQQQRPDKSGKSDRNHRVSLGACL